MSHNYALPDPSPSSLPSCTPNTTVALSCSILLIGSGRMVGLSWILPSRTLTLAILSLVAATSSLPSTKTQKLPAIHSRSLLHLLVHPNRSPPIYGPHSTDQKAHSFIHQMTHPSTINLQRLGPSTTLSVYMQQREQATGRQRGQSHVSPPPKQCQPISSRRFGCYWH